MTDGRKHIGFSVVFIELFEKAYKSPATLKGMFLKYGRYGRPPIAVDHLSIARWKHRLWDLGVNRQHSIRRDRRLGVSKWSSGGSVRGKTLAETSLQGKCWCGENDNLSIVFLIRQSVHREKSSVYVNLLKQQFHHNFRGLGKWLSYALHRPFTWRSEEKRVPGFVQEVA